MKKPSIAIKLNPRDYSGLINLANRVFNSMTGNLAFSTPLPTLLSVQSATTACAVALAARGDAHTHGTTEDTVVLRETGLTLRNTLVALAAYVTTTASNSAGNNYPTMTTIMSSSGYGLKSDPTPQGLLGPVRNLRCVFDAGLNQNQFKATWTAPENVTSKNNVKSYLVFKGTTPVFSAAMQVATTSKGEFMDENSTSATVTLYLWIVPFGAAGNGAASDVLMVTLTAV